MAVTRRARSASDPRAPASYSPVTDLGGAQSGSQNHIANHVRPEITGRDLARMLSSLRGGNCPDTEAPDGELAGRVIASDHVMIRRSGNSATTLTLAQSLKHSIWRVRGADGWRGVATHLIAARGPARRAGGRPSSARPPVRASIDTGGGLAGARIAIFGPYTAFARRRAELIVPARRPNTPSLRVIVDEKDKVLAGHIACARWVGRFLSMLRHPYLARVASAKRTDWLLPGQWRPAHFSLSVTVELFVSRRLAKRRRRSCFVAGCWLLLLSPKGDLPTGSSRMRAGHRRRRGLAAPSKIRDAGTTRVSAISRSRPFEGRRGSLLLTGRLARQRAGKQCEGRPDAMRSTSTLSLAPTNERTTTPTILQSALAIVVGCARGNRCAFELHPLSDLRVRAFRHDLRDLRALRRSVLRQRDYGEPPLRRSPSFQIRHAIAAAQLCKRFPSARVIGFAKELRTWDDAEARRRTQGTSRSDTALTRSRSCVIRRPTRLCA